MNDDESVLVCLSVEDYPTPATNPRKRQCDLCGSAIWVARSSPKTAKRWCNRCAALQIDPKTKIQEPTERQKAEIEAYFKSRAN
jgi:hypothetical protein